MEGLYRPCFVVIGHIHFFFTKTKYTHTHTHLPSESSEGCTGVRGPGDDEQQDDDECDLGHLPFASHLVEPLRRVSVSFTIDLCYCSVRHADTQLQNFSPVFFTFAFSLICNFICHLNSFIPSSVVLLYFSISLIRFETLDN